MSAPFSNTLETTLLRRKSGSAVTFHGKHKRVLALHGKGSTPAKFEKTLSPLITSVSDFDWVFLEAPFSSGNGAAWWTLPANQRSFEALEYPGIETSLHTIEQAWKLEGPFDAIIGHSQGAMLAAIFLSLGALGEHACMPSCAILSGAAWPNPYDARLRAISKNGGLTVPTLHCWGTADDVNPPAMAAEIRRTFGSLAEALEHGGGHITPMNAHSVTRMRQFLEASV